MILKPDTPCIWMYHLESWKADKPCPVSRFLCAVSGIIAWRWLDFTSAFCYISSSLWVFEQYPGTEKKKKEKSPLFIILSFILLRLAEKFPSGSFRGAGSLSLVQAEHVVVYPLSLWERNGKMFHQTNLIGFSPMCHYCVSEHLWCCCMNWIATQSNQFQLRALIYHLAIFYAR